MLPLGFESDLEVCAELDATDVVPTMEGGRITLGEPRPETREPRGETR